jgi:acyl-CoA synthetase (AMP-forming)/AMP-acid ligase II
VWVSGPHIPDGYWGQPKLSAETFGAQLQDTAQGAWLRTGDLGFLKGDELFITGRLKDLVIIDGRNHYPQDLEQTVEASHTALNRDACAAFSIDINGREQLVIVAEAKRQYNPTLNDAGTKGDQSRASRAAELKEVIQTIRTKIADAHQLEVLKVALVRPGTIPKTSSGKIQRKRCRAAFLADDLEIWSLG